MKKHVLKITAWKEFLLHQIANVDYGTKLDIGKMTYNNPTINFVSRTSYNNGVKAVVDKIENIEPYPAGDITIALGGSIGTTCVQTDPFYTSQNVAVVHFDNNVPFEAKLFICRLVKTECDNKFKAFGRELNSHIKKDFSINLPQTQKGEPDWEWMSDYIKSLNGIVKEKMDEIKEISYSNKSFKTIAQSIDIDEFKKWAGLKNNPCPKQQALLDLQWEVFKIGDIFKTYTGGDLILGNVVEGPIPIVTHSAENNGINKFSEIIPQKRLFDHKRTIALADRGTFYATIQEQDFYIGTRVKALEFKEEYCSREVLAFITTIINNESFRFSYGRNCTGALDDLKIKLPAKDKETPNYEYMENYIKSLPYSNRI
ncbi:MAG: restriction endonuclease subunit S [Clostridia bacterium]|nr:restriction endonuclease subunit S [Clostridia bacterium]